MEKSSGNLEGSSGDWEESSSNLEKSSSNLEKSSGDLEKSSGNLERSSVYTKRKSPDIFGYLQCHWDIYLHESSKFHLISHCGLFHYILKVKRWGA
ncbi:Hypothetical predicted protein [Octopus vulgaris]|uniref:Uncharacterized protein n=1 Tax=Octopus vulgaris TaxID=6645 RepID=A0AA36B8H9_OCTVU|nr:Hypothetical predicted protein [Octopus vulgaris]